MDITPAILIFTPIFLPIVMEFGVNPVHFGTMIVYRQMQLFHHQDLGFDKDQVVAVIRTRARCQ